jgi:hypothetical protein
VGRTRATQRASRRRVWRCGGACVAGRRRAAGLAAVGRAERRRRREQRRWRRRRGQEWAERRWAWRGGTRRTRCSAKPTTGSLYTSSSPSSASGVPLLPHCIQAAHPPTHSRSRTLPHWTLTLSLTPNPPWRSNTLQLTSPTRLHHSPERISVALRCETNIPARRNSTPPIGLVTKTLPLPLPSLGLTVPGLRSRIRYALKGQPLTRETASKTDEKRFSIAP